LSLQQGEGEVITGLCVCRIEFQSGLQFGNGLCWTALVNKRQACQKMCSRLIRVERYSFTIFLERRSVDLLICVTVPYQSVNFSRVRIGSLKRFQAINTLRVLTCFYQRNSIGVT